MRNMVSNIYAKIKGYNLDESIDYISITRENITKNYQHWTRKEAKYLISEMQKKIKSFEHTGALSESLRDIEIYNTDNKVAVEIYTENESAKQNEFGTRPRFLNVKDNPELQQWINDKLNTDWRTLNSLEIGGPNSKVILGKSKNKFFFNTIEEYIAANPNKRFVKDIKKAIKKKK